MLWFYISEQMMHRTRHQMQWNLPLKNAIEKALPKCKVILTSLTPRLDNGKANLNIKHFNDHLKQLKVEVIDNTNITSNDLGKKGLHLSKSGKAKLARNIVNVLKVDSANWQVSCCSPSSLDFLRNKHKKNVLLGYINVNSIQNKLQNLFNEIRDYFDVFSTLKQS